MKKIVYGDLMEVVHNSDGEAWEITNDEPCANCGCEWSDVYYLYGRHRCDNCAKYPEDFTIIK